MFNFKTAIVFSTAFLTTNFIFAKENIVSDHKTAVILKSFKLKADQDLYCKLLKKEIYEWSLSTQPQPDCNIVLDDKTETHLIENYKKNAFGTIVVLQDNNENLKLKIINTIQTDGSDPSNLNWTILKKDQHETYISKVLKKYSEFHQSNDIIKQRLLDMALDSTSSLAKVDNQTYYDKDKKAYVSFKDAYGKYLNESKLQKNYLAAGVEISAILGLSTYNYYRLPKNQNPNFVDWDYNSFSDSIKNRLNNNALRFDNNGFSVNEGHYYAGFAYYMTARTAGLSRLESLLVTLGASSFWEYISEYKEVVSLNDQINTTLGGFIIGETTFQMCKIFRVAKTTYVNSIMKGICNAPRKGSNWLQAKMRNNGQMNLEESLESSPDIWAKLDLSISNIKTNVGGQTRTLNIKGQVIAIPMFEEPGQVQELLTDTVFSELNFEKSFGGNLNVFKLLAKTTLAAYYQKKLSLDKDEALNGYNLFIGPTVAFEVDESYYGQDEKDPRNDFRGIAHVIGSTIDITGYYKGTRLRAILDVYGDFAMVKSYAFDTYKQAQDNSTAIASSVLEKHGYYYATGSTQKIHLIIEKDSFEAGVSLSRSDMTSIESFDRNPDKKNIDLNPQDKIFNQKYWVAYKLNKDWRVEIGREYTKRYGIIPSFSQISSKTIKTYGQLIYSYK